MKTLYDKIKRHTWGAKHTSLYCTYFRALYSLEYFNKAFHNRKKERYAFHESFQMKYFIQYNFALIGLIKYIAFKFKIYYKVVRKSNSFIIY